VKERQSMGSMGIRTSRRSDLTGHRIKPVAASTGFDRRESLLCRGLVQFVLLAL